MARILIADSDPIHREAAGICFEQHGHRISVVADACFDNDGLVEPSRLEAAVAVAPVDALVQFLRIHRGQQRTKVMAAAQAAGKFDPALKALQSGIESRQLAALHQLQFARGKPFLETVRMAAMTSGFPQVRCEAISTLLDMETHPSAVAIAHWINDSGPTLTPRHEIVLHKVAQHYFHEIEMLAFSMENPVFVQFLRSAHSQAKETAALLHLAAYPSGLAPMRKVQPRFMVEA